MINHYVSVSMYDQGTTTITKYYRTNGYKWLKLKTMFTGQPKTHHKHW